ncbi:hypothetical protein EV182_000813, partial [Spiromyces aspiralis]
MGVLAKNKALIQRRKDPMPTLANWQDLLSRYSSAASPEGGGGSPSKRVSGSRLAELTLTNDKSGPKEPRTPEEYALLALRLLFRAASEPAVTWEQQSQPIRNAQRCLERANKLSWDDVEPEIYEALGNSAVPVACQMYMVASEPVSRQCILMLLRALQSLCPDALGSHLACCIRLCVLCIGNGGGSSCDDGAIRGHIGDDLAVYYSVEFVNAFAKQTLKQQSHAFYALFGIPAGLDALSRHFVDVMSSLVRGLRLAASELVNFDMPAKALLGSDQPESTTEPSTVTVLRHQAGVLQTLRTLAYYFKGPGALGSTLRQSGAQPMPTESRARVSGIVAEYYKILWLILSRRAFQVESRQIAAMNVVALLDGTDEEPLVRAERIGRELLGVKIVAEARPSEGSCWNIAQPHTQLQRRVFSDPISMLCIARAVACNASASTLLCPLTAESEGDKTTKLLHELLYTHIASVCGRLQQSPVIKVLGFDSMALWLNVTARMLFAAIEHIKSKDKAAFPGFQRDKVLQSISKATKECDISIPSKIQAEQVVALGERVISLQSERILGYLAGYWDDPLDAVQNQIKAIFEAIMDLGTLVSKAIPPPGRSTFGERVLSYTLSLDWNRKVKYSLLAALCPRLSTLTLQREQGDLIHQCLHNMSEAMLAPRIATFLEVYIRLQKDEIFDLANNDVTHSDACYAHWTNALVTNLLSPNRSRVRMLRQYVLPLVLAAFPGLADSLISILATTTNATTARSVSMAAARCGTFTASMWAYEEPEETLHYDYTASRQHVLIMVLHAARRLEQIDLAKLLHDSGRGPCTDLLATLKQAVHSSDWEVLADLLGLICETKKVTIPVSAAECDLLCAILSVSTNIPSAEYRQRQYSALVRLALRMVASCAHARRLATSGKIEEERRQGAEVLQRTIKTAKSWLGFATHCIYPGAPFASVATALGWLEIINNYFNPNRKVASTNNTFPGDIGLGDPKVLLSLLHVLLDHNYEANRRTAFDLLMAWPITDESADAILNVKRLSATKVCDAGGDGRPLEASRVDLAQWLIQHGLEKATSARADDSSRGATVIRWAFQRFVLSEGLNIPFPRTRMFVGAQLAEGFDDPTLNFLSNMLGCIRFSLDQARSNLLMASRKYPLHGILATMKALVDSVNFTSREVQSHASEWRALIRDIIDVTSEAADMVMSVLTNPSPEGNVPASFREMETKIDLLINKGLESGAAEDSSDDEESGALAAAAEYLEDMDEADDFGAVTGLEGAVGPRHQVILSYCWRTIKEYSALVCTIVTVPPAEDQVPLAGEPRSPPLAERVKGKSQQWEQALVTIRQLGDIGVRLRTLLTSIRHRGAFMAVYPWFTTLCSRLWRSPSPHLNHFLEAWLGQCLDSISICQVSVTRRSAGWPLCLLAILSCNREATNTFLPRAVNSLFGLIRIPFNRLDYRGGEEEPEKAADDTVDLPQVHAINMLRVLVDDKSIAASVYPFIERAFVLAIDGLRSPYWAIRNSSGLLFASLLRRVFGNKKTRDETSQLNGITGRELFTRFPGLHPFLMKQLEEAVDQIYSDNNLQSGQFMNLHPALYPCLTMLARLQPSVADEHREHSRGDSPEGSGNGLFDEEEDIAKDGNAAVALPIDLEAELHTKLNERNATIHTTTASTTLSMHNFIQLIEACAECRIYKTREMAARAFAPLILPQQVLPVLLYILEGLDYPRIPSNTIHGRLCQVRELLRVHLRNNNNEHLRKQIIVKVLPALEDLWVTIVDKCSCELVRSIYLQIIREFFFDDTTWWAIDHSRVPPGLADVKRLVVHPFQERIVKTCLVPLLEDILARDRVTRCNESSHAPGGYLTIRELTLMALHLTAPPQVPILVPKDPGSNILMNPMSNAKPLGLNPWLAIKYALIDETFYEARLDTLRWVRHHVDKYPELAPKVLPINELLATLLGEGVLPRQEVFGGLRGDPIIEEASIRLLTLLNTKFSPTNDHNESDYVIQGYPVENLSLHWDGILERMAKPQSQLVVQAQIPHMASLVPYLCLSMLQQSQIGGSDVTSVYRDIRLALSHTATAQRVERWVEFAASQAVPEASLPYREAACEAFVYLFPILRKVLSPEPGGREADVAAAAKQNLERTFALTATALLELLQDDDEDVRAMAAKVMISEVGTELAPKRTAEMFVYLAGQLMPNSPSLLEMLLDRLFGGRTFDNVSWLILNADTKLFQHEKPNIFKDEWCELHLLSYAILSASRSDDGEHAAEILGRLHGLADDCLQYLEQLDELLHSGNALLTFNNDA